MSNSTACEQFVVLMKKSNQFGDVVMGNLESRPSITSISFAAVKKENAMFGFHK